MVSRCCYLIGKLQEHIQQLSLYSIVVLWLYKQLLTQIHTLPRKCFCLAEQTGPTTSQRLGGVFSISLWYLQATVLVVPFNEKKVEFRTRALKMTADLSQMHSSDTTYYVSGFILFNIKHSSNKNANKNTTKSPGLIEQTYFIAQWMSDVKSVLEKHLDQEYLPICLIPPFSFIPSKLTILYTYNSVSKKSFIGLLNPCLFLHLQMVYEALPLFHSKCKCVFLLFPIMVLQIIGKLLGSKWQRMK